MKIKCIYKITNLINNKIYIGKTIDFKRRYKEYQAKSKNPYKYKSNRYEIILEMYKYGFDNFKFNIIEYCENELQLNEREIYWISKLNSRNSDIGYNKKTGGIGGKLTLDSIEKMRISSYGFKHTDEHKLKMSKPILVYKDNIITKYTSGKVFGDMINRDRTNISHAIRYGIPIKGYFIFYYNKSDRIGIPLKKSKHNKYYKILNMIEDEDVETIENKLHIVI